MMRFTIELLLENQMVPKDKNRIILSVLKDCFNSYSREYYNELYKEKENKIKDFTFSLYMGNCKFLKEEILIPDKKIYLNFSTYKYEDGIMFYNSLLKNKEKEYPIRTNIIKIGKLSLKKEKTIYNNEIIFKTMSPIVVREHNGNNKKTWYHSLNTDGGKCIFMKNLNYQLEHVFGDRVLTDFKDMSIQILKHNKEVKIKNYGIEVLGNIGKMRIKGQPYIIDYLYKAGIGSKRGSGFGMVDIV